jgi:transaldolase
MKIFIDTAEIPEIIKAYDTGLIDGVTTNPTLIMKSGNTLQSVAILLNTQCPELDSISCEVVADTAEEMLQQAQYYIDISPSMTIKLPCTVEGLKACKELYKKDVQTNVTLVFSVAQAILAAKAGATFISPFVGRWEDNSVDGLDLIARIRKVYDQSPTHYNYHIPYILGASVRDVRQVEQCAINGADVVTIPPKVFWAMYKNVMTDKGLDQFNIDWKVATNSVVKDTEVDV